MVLYGVMLWYNPGIMEGLPLVDPLGRVCILADHTWDRHILVAHPDMEGGRDYAERAITSPRSNWLSGSDADVRVYYGDGPSPYLMVAVKTNIRTGVVLTAHIAKKETGAQREWPQS
jgi:hypothetical protein